MSAEFGPESNATPLRHFDKTARTMPRLKQIMEVYLKEGYLDQHGVFEEDEERIDFTGEELALWFVNSNASPLQISAMRRSIRFGLRLSMELSRRAPGYMAGLDSLVDIIEAPSRADEIKTSYGRYLSKMPQLRQIIMPNLRALTNGATIAEQLPAQNVISFVVEEADIATSGLHGMRQSMFDGIYEMLGIPPEH